MSRNKYPAAKKCPYCGILLQDYHGGYSCSCKSASKISLFGILNQPLESARSHKQNKPKKGK